MFVSYDYDVEMAASTFQNVSKLENLECFFSMATV